ncbi:DUF945 family protein [Aliiglaciecola sp. LCG003]|uniref:YdgA family protein n=1 Tax=Aliiglaciecola sp. LCG003 TaxID=3053655 RepID=UPI002573D897|nr:DUF945 family protein [Aliiglaciecola sp. LCG003]WJG10368.1 DUF945 family protein [Aliiglaciecola sp. LCG003]
MKKRYLIAALVVAAVLVLPKIISMQVAKSVTNYAAQVNQVQGYMAEVTEFNEGWFSSKGKIKLTVDMAKLAPDMDLTQEQQKPELILSFNSYHGPIFFSESFGLGLAKWSLIYSGETLRQKLVWDAARPFYQVLVEHSLFGGTELQDSVAAFIAQKSDGTREITFTGYVGEGDDSTGTFKYKGTSDAFKASAETGVFDVTDLALVMEVDGDIVKAMNGELLDSLLGFMIGDITFAKVGQDKPEFSIENFNIFVSSKLDDEEAFATMNQEIHIGNVEAQGYSAKSLNLELEINQISVPFLKAYQEFARNMSSFSEVEIQQKSLEFLRTNALDLLQGNPEINITDLSAKLPEGELKAHSKNKLVGIDAVPAAPADPKFWLDHTVSDTNIVIDKALAIKMAVFYMTNQFAQNPQTVGMSKEDIAAIVEQQAPMFIEQLQVQGLMVDKGDKYESNLIVKDGQVLLNGTAMPLPY